jgi:OPA family glycerol-3-phosphate transporter-like MFS transporter/OPA family sugar phosphate sensor protein UhpC-like MFS transporter
VLAYVVSVFREAPDAAPLEDRETVDELYARSRNEALIGSMIAYGLFYVLRKNLSVAAPLLIQQLGYTKEDIGAINGKLYITYGLGKFASGLVADRASPRALMLLGLVLSIGASLAFGASTELGFFAVAWAANGLFQSLGAPASAKIVAVWFGARERGTKTAIWNISHQAGGGVALLVASAFADHWGWRWCFYGPSLFVLAAALVVARYLHDRPETLGLPPIEVHRQEPTQQEDEARALSFGRLLLGHVLGNPRVWIVALASGFTYVVRTATIDFAPTYMVERLKLDPGDAGRYASLLEFVGIPGMLICGWLSDRVLGGRRAPVVCVSLVLLAASVGLLLQVPKGNLLLLQLALGLVGFFTYGPQCLLAGVAPVDMSSKRVAAAAVGFTGLVSYGAATLSSNVSGWLAHHVGWESTFAFWAAAALVGALLCVPLWRKAPGSAS